MILPYNPNNAVVLASPYGPRTDPFTGAQNVPHGGVDLVSRGDKTICAVVPGVVGASVMIIDKINRTWEWGNYIRIDGDDGLSHYYCHLSRRDVSVGDRVEAGQPIGVEGSTGRSTGSHLHYEVRRNGMQINPAEVLGIPNVIGTYKIDQEEEIVEEEKNHPADSEPNDWAKEAVEWAVENEIIFGTGDGDLRLRDNCTREQMIVFLHRFAQSIGRA